MGKEGGGGGEGGGGWGGGWGRGDGEGGKRGGKGEGGKLYERKLYSKQDQSLIVNWNMVYV